jgi:hypothetical protein
MFPLKNIFFEGVKKKISRRMDDDGDLELIETVNGHSEVREFN